MKRADIDTLFSDAMISEPQHAAIVTRYSLQPRDSKLGGIFAMIGAALCVAGIALVISANWGLIPRPVKVITAIVVLIAFHAGGVWSTTRHHDRVGAALHVAGSVMFLLLIALIGQVYNLSPRPPNAILLWLIGICFLPWVLRSRAQFFLLLSALVIWLGLEAAARDSLLHMPFVRDFVPTMSWMGALVLALSCFIALMPARLRGEKFEQSAELTGAAIIALGLLLCVLGWYSVGSERTGDAPFDALHTLPLWLTAASLACVVARTLSDRASSLAVRIVWTMAVAAAALVPWIGVANPSLTDASKAWAKTGPLVWIASATLFCFALVLIQRGIARSSRALINLGIAFVGANIIAVYFRLFGNMMNTGITFVATGGLLVLVAWQIERWRRRLSLRVDAHRVGASHE